MAIIEFENGKRVEFDGNPTAADIQAVAQQLGISAPSTAKKPGFFEEVGSAFKKRQEQVFKTDASDMNPLTKVLNRGGQFAGLIGDVAGEAIERVPVVGDALGYVGEKVAAAPSVQKGLQDYEAWKTAHPEAATNLESVINIGGLTGAGIGAKVAKDTIGDSVVSGIKKGITDIKEAPGKLPFASTPAKVDAKLLDLVMEKRNKKMSIAAIEASGRPGGAVQRPGFGKNIEVEATPKDLRMREAVRDIVDPNQNAVINNTRINNEIERIAAEEVTPFLQANPRAFNVATINSRLREIEMPDLFKTDQSLEKTYQLIRQRALKTIEKYPKTMEGLWQARKDFDRQIVDQFGDAAFDSEKNSAIKRATQDIRREMNNFIGENIGDDTFATQMRRISDMYDARYNMSEKAYDLLQTNKFSRKWNKLTSQQKTLVLVGGGLLVGPQGTRIIFGQ